MFIVQWEFCLNILPVNMLVLNQSNPLNGTSFPFSSENVMLVYNGILLGNKEE
jgi:hypothetical protein